MMGFLHQLATLVLFVQLPSSFCQNRQNKTRQGTKLENKFEVVSGLLKI